ncbi:MAG: ABC transporter ATP-binding protein, partial [Clostridia bacterium]|nr:ABC transporter ATP-binding protein [Clostridia bacterium]
MPPGMRPFEYDRVAPPKNVKDVPRYLRELLGGFFGRFGYIVRLVWETGHWILVALSLIALFNGVTPVVGSLISTAILNELQTVITDGGLSGAAFWSSPVVFLIIFFFVYKILKQAIGSLDTAVTRIAGEKVVRQVKLRIMEKSKTVDLASFDLPEFYEKMENANREAGNRPLTILSQTFTIVSTTIELISYLVILFTAPGLWWLPLILFAVSLPSAVINFVYRRKNFQYMRHRSKERRQMNYYSEILVNKDMVKEVRMFDLADSFIGRYVEVFKVYYRGLRQLILSETLWHVGLGILSALVNLLFYVLIARLVFVGEIRIGDYTLYTGAIGTVASCVATLIARSAHIYEGTLFIDNLIAFMKQEPGIVPNRQPAEQVARGEGHCIHFVGVSVRYPGTERDVIKNVNLTIRPGETVVLVGLNGAGKT